MCSSLVERFFFILQISIANQQREWVATANLDFSALLGSSYIRYLIVDYSLLEHYYWFCLVYLKIRVFFKLFIICMGPLAAAKMINKWTECASKCLVFLEDGGHRLLVFKFHLFKQLNKRQLTKPYRYRKIKYTIFIFTIIIIRYFTDVWSLHKGSRRIC